MIWRYGESSFDAASGRLRVAGVDTPLDRTGSAILGRLIEDLGEPVGKDDLLAAGWPGRIVHENSLAKAIGRLRRALGDDAEAIVAVYGSGYCLEGAFEPEGEPQSAANPDSWLDSLRLRAGAAPRWALTATLVLLCTAAGAVGGWYAGQAGEDDGRRQAEALASYLSSDLLSSSDPYAATTEDQSVREIVERTAATMDRRFADDPRTLALLHRVIANTFSGWGEYEKAVSHLDRARNILTRLDGIAAENAIPVDISLCQQLRLGGDTRRGERICPRAVQLARRHKSPLVPEAQVAEAKLDFEIGEYARAAEKLGNVLADGADLEDEQRADAEWFHGLALRKLARFDEADAALRSHLELRRRLHGPDHPLTAWAHADYGDFLVTVGRFRDAEKQLAAAERIYDARLGPDHPESMSPRYSRAISLLWQAEPERALQILRPMLARYRETLGSDHFWTLYVITEVALAEAQLGNADTAVSLLREARLTGARILYGRDGKAAQFHMRWARAFAELGRLEEAQDEARRALAAIDAAGFAPTHPWRARLACIRARADSSGDGADAKHAFAGRCIEAFDASPGLPETYPALVEAKRIARSAT
ncbi:tetratricopeptide repeat protein [Citromicrobium bathyomarinum]